MKELKDKEDIFARKLEDQSMRLKRVEKTAAEKAESEWS